MISNILNCIYPNLSEASDLSCQEKATPQVRTKEGWKPIFKVRDIGCVNQCERIGQKCKKVNGHTQAVCCGPQGGGKVPNFQACSIVPTKKSLHSFPKKDKDCENLCRNYHEKIGKLRCIGMS